MKENGKCLGNIKSLLKYIAYTYIYSCIVFEKRNELKIITDLIRQKEKAENLETYNLSYRYVSDLFMGELMRKRY